jgi:hypothetical protein
MLYVAFVAALAIGPAGPDLPENPCDLIAAADIAAVGQLVVQPGRRVPGRMETGPGSNCVFDTGPKFGQIILNIPPRAERRAVNYREARESYFRTYPGSGRPVPGVGQDAWLGAGTSLRVWIRDDDYFTLMTQHYQPDSGDLVTKIAKFVLAKR